MEEEGTILQLSNAYIIRELIVLKRGGLTPSLNTNCTNLSDEICPDESIDDAIPDEILDELDHLTSCDFSDAQLHHCGDAFGTSRRKLWPTSLVT